MSIAGGGLLNPVLTFFDSNGNPLAGGSVLFTQVGVGTHQAIYSDPALSTPLTNPVPLNAAGRTSTSTTGPDTPVYLQQLPYDFTVTDAASVTVYGPITVSGSSIDPNANYAFGGNVTIAGTLGVTGLTTLTTLTGGWKTITVTDTGTQNDYAPGLVGHTIVRCNNATLLTITGLSGGTSGQRVRFISVGAGQVDFAHQNTGSTSAADRLINFATSGNTPLAAGVGTCEYEYDATTARWRLIQHEQGAPITRTFAAGNYTASGSMTWTVASATSDAFVLRGRELHLLEVVSGTVAGSASTELRVTLPQGFTASTRATNTCVVQTNTTLQTGSGDAQSAVAYVRFFVDVTTVTNWGVGSVAGTVFYNEVIAVS